MPKSNDEMILDLLEKILRVLALQLGSEKSITERAGLLKIAGLDNRTIADILGTTDATIRALTTNLRAKQVAARKKRK